MESEMAEPVIVIDPEIIGGTPCFRGTRVPFKNLIDYLEGGHSRSEGIITSQDRVKNLLDECLPLNLRHSFPQHEVHTVQWAGLKGKKKGELVLAAEDAAYDVLITVDKNLPHQ
jgi:hypothetical protein